MTYAEAVDLLRRHLGDRWIDDGEIRLGLRGQGTDQQLIEVHIPESPYFSAALVHGLVAAQTMYTSIERMCRKNGDDGSADDMAVMSAGLKAAIDELRGLP